jgi:hypothetical protein
LASIPRFAKKWQDIAFSILISIPHNNLEDNNLRNLRQTGTALAFSNPPGAIDAENIGRRVDEQTFLGVFTSHAR